MHKKTIMICDDDDGILDMLNIILEESGFDIILIKDSLLIYEEIERRHPDLVLLDLWMPVLSGDQVLRVLKNKPETRSLPIIVISASREGEFIANQAGADDFIAKPFDIESLLTKVCSLIGA